MRLVERIKRRRGKMGNPSLCNSPSLASENPSGSFVVCSGDIVEGGSSPLIIFHISMRLEVKVVLLRGEF